MAKKEKIVEHKKQNRFNKDGKQWAERRTSSYFPYQSTFYLQEYLKKNTDVYHKVDLKDLMVKKEGLVIDESVEVFGTTWTIREKLKELASTTYYLDNVIENTRVSSEYDDDVLENSRIIFDDVEQLFLNEDEKSADESDKENIENLSQKKKRTKKMRYNNIYYNHPFSYSELDSLVESINLNKTLTSIEAETLIEKLKAELASDHYKSVNINKIIEPSAIDKDKTRANIAAIDNAIKSDKKISINFYNYNIHKELECVNYRKYALNPYYIFANGNHFYLIAATDYKKEMMFLRVDMMGEIEVLDAKRTPVEQMPGIPNEWDPSIQFKHIGMSFDKPQTTHIKVKMYDNGKKLSSTFLVDAFGKSYNLIERKGEYAIIQVECSPFGIRNWALQYSDRVEVLPKLHENDVDVRGMVIESLKALNEKYNKI